jgi:hypothetical protein
MFVGECSELAVRAYIFGLADHGANRRVLVKEDFRNKESIWEIGFTKIKVGYSVRAAIMEY